MPFKSKAQRAYLFANHPKIAKKWAKEYPDQGKLPEYAHKEAEGGEIEPIEPEDHEIDFQPEESFAEGGDVAPVEPPDELVASADQAPVSQETLPEADNGAIPIEPPDEIAEAAHRLELEEKYGTPSEMAKTVAEGLGRGFAGPLAPLGERVAGVNPKEIRAREEASPILNAVSEATGFGVSMFTPMGEGRLITKVGEVASKALEVANINNKIARAAIRGATEMGLLSASDEASKAVMGDPNQTVQTAMVNTGMGALLGAAGAAAFAGAPDLIKAAGGNKLVKFAEDFKGRIAQRASGVDPVEQVTDELKALHGNIRSMNDEMFGPEGLKAQNIAKSVPSEITEHIANQTESISNKLEDTINKMASDPDSYPVRFTKDMQQLRNEYLGAVTNPEATPAQLFEATQNLKQKVQEFARFSDRLDKIDPSYKFVKLAKNISYDLRNALEDTKVWGKAGQIQAASNKAFTELLPALKDFEKKFTSSELGQRVIDPGKVNTYMNQLGKPNAELKQSAMKNFLDPADKYQQIIADLHSNLGLENPFPPTSTAALRETLEKPTLGAKFADFLIKQGLEGVGSKVLGGAAGAAAGHAISEKVAHAAGKTAGEATGIPFAGHLGALLGTYALAPFFKKALGLMGEAFFTKAGDAAALKSSIELTAAAVKGDNLITRAAKNLFKAGAEVIPEHMIPKDKDLHRLSTRINTIQAEPEDMTEIAKGLDHYLPNHATALSQTLASGVSYLHSLKPSDTPKAPLDTKIPPTPIQQAQYNRALQIAQQPLMVLQRIKDGTITSKDVQHLKALAPQLYTHMIGKLTDEMTQAISKKVTIPYKTRMGLSLFMGQPMDSTLSPMGIQIAQASAAAGLPQAPQSAPQPKAHGSPKAIKAIPTMARTALESRLIRNQNAT